MRFTFTAPHLNPPTYDTLREYSERKFEKIHKFLKKDKLSNNEIRISVNKVRELFELSVQVLGIRKTIAKVKDKNLRRAIDTAVNDLKRSLSEFKDKNQRNHRVHLPDMVME